jgi:hypothetical protein
MAIADTHRAQQLYDLSDGRQKRSVGTSQVWFDRRFKKLRKGAICQQISAS